MAPWLPGWVAGIVAGALTLGLAAWSRRGRGSGSRLADLAQPPGARCPHFRAPLTPRGRALVLLAIGTIGLGWAAPPLAILPGAGAIGWRRWREIAGRRDGIDGLRRELPEVVDLLHVAVASGLNLSQAIGVVGERAPPQLGAAFGRAADDVAKGARVADAIDEALAPLGDPVLPLSSVLRAAASYGTPLPPALDRLAFDARLMRRRHAEDALRRVPVKLLFPLVLLVLPAFALLTVVPLLAGALRSLPL